MKHTTAPPDRRQKRLKVIAFTAIVFGVATLLSGGRSLFTDEGRIAAGDYVPFVLWFNFIAGFAYIAAGIGLIRQQTWAYRATLAIAISTVLVFLFLGIHILTGGHFENRTVFAMLLRSGFWLIVTKLSYQAIHNDTLA